MAAKPGGVNHAPEHGGDLAWARARFPAFSGRWLDLSTGINPWPYPTDPFPGHALHRLPAAADLTRLHAAAAAAYDGGDAECVAAAPGAQALIQLLARLRSPARVTVIGPTYGGHAAAWSDAGHTVSTLAGPPPLGSADVIVVTNPNNPDGRVIPPDRLRSWIPSGGWLVVDESFSDTAPQTSLRPLPAGVIALRSFGKFFGLPGLRLGFALAAPEIAASIRRALGPWPVSGPAIAIATRALTDRAWQTAARRRLAAAAAGLDHILARLHCRPLGGTALFRLVHAPPGLFEHLGANGIYARCFGDQPEWLRFGLPGEEEPRLAALASHDGRQRA